ncbi:GGDEF domain-containing protein [Streptomyces sp. NPDC052236]|uniref:GGDEF domain-containing protein n=1 Tax=Streptomyces sp. NPDC052236 TaxID=3365686 RepID=UPI0037CDC40E
MMSHLGLSLQTLIPAVLAAGWAVHAGLLYRRLTRTRRDPLTGLLTRAGWTRRARRITAHRNAAVVLIDLDRFKRINDRVGHAAGDAILAATGDRLAAWCGRGAAGRLGGDEFVVALVDNGDLDQRLAELRTLLCQPVEHDGQLLKVGASIGVARLADLPTATLSAALGAADAAMYRAKGRGRRGRRLPRVIRSTFRLAA